jgi:hypothetical protein
MKISFISTLRSSAAWLTLIAAVLSCQSSGRPSPPAEGSAAAAPSDSVSAHHVLDRMDARTPVPLLPMMAEHQKRNMRDHLVAVQELTAALAVGDFSAVRRAAGRMGSSEQMTRMCEHLGAHAPGFTEVALRFHQTADTIAEAATRQDRDAVLEALNRTLAVCTSCHSTYKQQVVDDATWAALSVPAR